MANRPYDVIAVGNPFVDIIIQVDEEFVQKLPGAKGGMVPINYEALQAIIQQSRQEPTYLFGGSGANTITGLANLGHKCGLLGRVGQDEAGKRFVERLSELGIESFLMTSSTPTAQALCLITPDRERTMRSFLGASREMNINDINPELFQTANLVHIEGYSLLNLEVTEKAMEAAKQAGAKVSFDLGSFEIVEKYKERIANLLAKYVDLVFANVEEVRHLTRYQPEDACRILTDLVDIAVVLQGKEGCLVGQGAKRVHSPAITVEAIDTTGAGDLFASGFLHGYLRGKEIDQCARYGCLTGAMAVQVKGVDVSADEWQALKLTFD